MAEKASRFIVKDLLHEDISDDIDSIIEQLQSIKRRVSSMATGAGITRKSKSKQNSKRNTSRKFRRHHHSLNEPFPAPP